MLLQWSHFSALEEAVKAITSEAESEPGTVSLPRLVLNGS